jgi:hypothetical protein
MSCTKKRYTMPGAGASGEQLSGASSVKVDEEQPRCSSCTIFFATLFSLMLIHHGRRHLGAANRFTLVTHTPLTYCWTPSICKNIVGYWLPSVDQQQGVGAACEQTCLTALAALDGTAAVKQLCNLEALGASAVITRSLPAFISCTRPPPKHVLTSRPAVTQWTRTLTWHQRAQRLPSVQATSCASERNWSMWGHVRCNPAIEQKHA